MDSPFHSNNLRERFENISALSNDRIGHNNAGVLKVRDTLTNKICIEKRLLKEDIANGHAKREMDVLRQLCGHENILRLIECELEGLSLAPNHSVTATIWTEWCNRGSLHDFVFSYVDHEQRIPELILRHIMESLAEAVRYCQQGPVGSEKERWNTVYHRDITLHNVFLADSPDPDNPPRVVLGDFGLAITKEDIRSKKGASTENHVGIRDEGDENYMESLFEEFFAPPEFPHFHCKSDVYQIGVVMYCLMFKLIRPYDYIAPLLKDKTVASLDEDVWDQEDCYEARYSDELLETVSGCLVADASLRYDVDVLLNRLQNPSNST